MDLVVMSMMLLLLLLMLKRFLWLADTVGASSLRRVLY